MKTISRLFITLAIGVSIFAPMQATIANEDLKDIAIKFKDATSYYLLAQKYVLGSGGTRNYKEALRWYKEAAKLDHVKSKLQLGKIYFAGLGINIDYEQAAQWLTDPADQGYNEAQYMLGMIYLSGAGKTYPRNERKAFELIKKAADEFNGDAIFQIAQMYFQGIGTSKNISKAKKYAQLAIEDNIIGAQNLLTKIKSVNQPIVQTKLVTSLAQEPKKPTLTEAANAGDRAAQFQLGQNYLNGVNGFNKSTQSAIKWISIAAEQDHPQAQLSMGLFYYNGKVLKRNLSKAKHWLAKAADNDSEDAKPLISGLNIVTQDKDIDKNKLHSTSDLFLAAAKNGDKDAQHKVGLLYLYGEDGMPQDEQRALKWLLAAANQNHTNAQFQSGMMYYRPNLSDNNLAQQWLIKAANNGHTDAQYFLGTIYNRQERYDNAVKWLDIAFKNNHHDALDLLVDLYTKGRVKNIGYTRVLAWLERAGRSGFRETQYHLGKHYLENEAISNHKQKGFAWIEKAARKGHVPAQFKLAVLFQQGIGVDKHYTRSARWFREAAKDGHTQAQFELAEQYRQGLGVPRTESKAKQWYKAAADQGHAEAKMRLGGRRY